MENAKILINLRFSGIFVRLFELEKNFLRLEEVRILKNVKFSNQNFTNLTQNIESQTRKCITDIYFGLKKLEKRF